MNDIIELQEKIRDTAEVLALLIADAPKFPGSEAFLQEIKSVEKRKRRLEKGLRDAAQSIGCLPDFVPVEYDASDSNQMARLEEHLETLESRRETRRAFARAAEVDIKVAELGVKRTADNVVKGVASQELLDQMRLEVEAAKAQYDVHVAELREIELKLKHARKRLDEAKAIMSHLPVLESPLPRLQAN